MVRKNFNDIFQNCNLYHKKLHQFGFMKLYNTNNLNHFQLSCLLSTMIAILSLALLIHQNTYAESNKNPAISTLDELVNVLVTGVKLENIITVPNEFT